MRASWIGPFERTWLIGLSICAAFGLGITLGALGPPLPASAAPRAIEPGVWRAEMGDFTRLVGAVAFATDDIWAVGDGIVHFDGTAWRQVLDAARPGFNAIDGISATQLWAVGEIGRDPCGAVGMIYRYDGARWQPEPAGTHAPLYDIDMLSPTDGWAVGGIGVGAVVRYDGRAWRMADVPEVRGLRAVQARAADDVWAVGDRGTIVHFDGTDWESVEGPDFANLTDINVHETGFGWAVGIDRKSYSGVTIRLAGGKWTLDSFNEMPQLLSVQTLGPDFTLAVGDGGVLMHHDGTAWREIGRTYPGGFDPWGLMADAGADSDTDAGVDTATDVDTATGTETNVDSDPNVDSDTDPTSPSPDGQLPPDNRWTRGMLHALVPLPGNETFLAVGDRGQVVQVDDTLQWKELHTGRDLFAIDMLDAGYGWVVGKGGAPIMWDGQAWTSPPAPPHARWLTAVDVVARDDVWAAGHRGTLMHWDGRAWTELPAFTWLDIGAMSFSGPDDGWIVAANDWEEWFEGTAESYIYRWDGRTWRLATRACGIALVDVEAVSAQAVWFASQMTWGPNGPQDSPGRVLKFDGRGFTWQPVLGDASPAAPAATPRQLVRGADGSLWGIGEGLARYADGAWRTVAREGFYFDAAAGADATGFWAISGNVVIRYTLGEGIRTVELPNYSFDGLAVVRDAGGVADLWLIGDASTVVRYRAPAADRPFPDATATSVLPAPALHPTPTPDSAFDRDEALERVLARADPDDTGEYKLGHLTLTTLGAFQDFWSRDILDIPEEGDEGSWRWESRGNLAPCALGPEYPVWIADFDTSPGCPSHVFVLLDGRGGDAYVYACYPRKVASVYLPLALQPKVAGPTPAEPEPTARVRSLTPEPMPTVLGPCPTPTPMPTEEGEG